MGFGCNKQEKSRSDDQFCKEEARYSETADRNDTFKPARDSLKMGILSLLSSKFKGITARSINISLYFLASLAQMGVGLALSPILSVYFEPTDFAVVGFFNSFTALYTPLVGLTLSSYYARSYYRLNPQQRIVLRRTVASTLVSISAGILFVLLIGFWFYSRLSGLVYAFFPNAILCYSAVLFSNLYSLYLVEMRLSKNAKGYLKISLLHHGIYFLVMVLLCAFLKLGATGSLTATLLVSMGFGAYTFRNMVDKFQIDWKVLKDALSFCWPLIIAAGMQYFSSGIDKALLVNLNDDYSFALYNISFKFVTYMVVFFSSISMTIEPDIYQAIAQKRYRRLLMLITGILVAKSVMVLGFIVMSPVIINILTVGRYMAAVGFTRIVSLKAITSSFYHLLSTVINGLGYSKVTLANRILSAVAVTMMFKYLITRFGFTGAAWGQVLSYVVMSIFSLLFLTHKVLAHRSKRKAINAIT
jgi:O-antigen/teichoic acid export membrane protein